MGLGSPEETRHLRTHARLAAARWGTGYSCTTCRRKPDRPPRRSSHAPPGGHEPDEIGRASGARPQGPCPNMVGHVVRRRRWAESGEAEEAARTLYPVCTRPPQSPSRPVARRRTRGGKKMKRRGPVDGGHACLRGARPMARTGGHPLATGRRPPPAENKEGESGQARVTRVLHRWPYRPSATHHSTGRRARARRRRTAGEKKP